MAKQLLLQILFSFYGITSGSTQNPPQTQIIGVTDDDGGGGAIDKFDIFSQNFTHPGGVTGEGEEGVDYTPFQPLYNYTFNELEAKGPEIVNCECGTGPYETQVSPWIQGGEEAGVNEFPWVTALIRRHEFPNGTILKEHFCGGSLINNRFVLTAQHCLLGLSVSKTEVWLNEHDILLSTETVGETLKRRALRFIPHPAYNKFMHYNDLALIELDEDVDISDSRLRPICLPKKESQSYDNAITAGWGQMGFGGPKSDKLLKVDLPIIPNQECINGSSVSYYRHRVTANSICAGDLRNGKKDTCPGDSGGGLFSRQKPPGKKNFELIGVSSFGVRCGEIGLPGVYVNILKYVKWIEYESRTGRQCRS